MRTLGAFLLALLALCVAQHEPNGLGAHPIDPVGTTGANVIRGYAWEDLNRDGMQQKDEPPIPGIYTALYFDSYEIWPAVPSTLIGQEVTGPDGIVLYSCLNSGKYSVRIWGLPEGYEYTTPGLGYESINSDAFLTSATQGTAQTPTITILGPQRVTYDFGVGIRKVVHVGAIQGFAWFDTNYNGVQDTTEKGLADVVVDLDLSGKIVANTTSDMDGIFTFANVTPGVYKLHFDISALGNGLVFTQPYLGTARNRDSDVIPETGDTVEFTVNAGFTVTDIDVGIVPSPGTLEGTFWLDQNRDGIQNADEHGFANLQVSILDHNFGLVRTETTDASGKFSVEIDSVSYYVRAQIDTALYEPTPMHVGLDPSVWSDLDAQAQSPLITVNPGKTSSMRGGLIPLLNTIEFLVFQDFNENGLYDAFLGDGVFPNYNVTLLNSTHSPIKWKLTSDSGIATFTNVPEGTYSLSLTLPGSQWGFVPYRASNQSNSNVDSDISSINGSVGTTGPLTLTSGQLVKNLAAGMKRLYSSISGYVFQDFNRNGVKDATDVPLSGITLHLMDAQGIFATVVTSSTGDYTFTKLDAGTYGVQIDNDTFSTYKLSPPHQSPDGSMIDSEFPTNGLLTIVLGTNVQYCCADAALQALNVLPAAIEGFVWDDYVSRTGIQTGSDTPISGVSILLRDPNGNTIATATSRSNGIFTFTDIVPGKYELVAVISSYTLAPYHAGNDSTRDSDFTSFGTTGLFNIYEGQTITDLDLGLIPKDGIVSGKVWFDSNGDGINSGETALAGVTVSLYPITNGVRGSPLRTVTTSSNGQYSFTAVRPQSYQVYFDKPSSAWAFSPKHAGTDTRLDSDVNPGTGFTDTFTVSPQQTVSNIDAGMKIA